MQYWIPNIWHKFQKYVQQFSEDTNPWKFYKVKIWFIFDTFL